MSEKMSSLSRRIVNDTWHPALGMVKWELYIGSGKNGAAVEERTEGDGLKWGIVIVICDMIIVNIADILNTSYSPCGILSHAS